MNGELTRKQKMAVKIYVVYQRVNLPKNGEPNVRIIDTKLTASAAQDIVNAVPGTWYEKRLATK